MHQAIIKSKNHDCTFWDLTSTTTVSTTVKYNFAKLICFFTGLHILYNIDGVDSSSYRMGDTLPVTSSRFYFSPKNVSSFNVNKVNMLIDNNNIDLSIAYCQQSRCDLRNCLLTKKMTNQVSCYRQYKLEAPFKLCYITCHFSWLQFG